MWSASARAPPWCAWADAPKSADPDPAVVHRLARDARATEEPYDLADLPRVSFTRGSAAHGSLTRSTANKRRPFCRILRMHRQPRCSVECHAADLPGGALTYTPGRPDPEIQTPARATVPALHSRPTPPGAASSSPRGPGWRHPVHPLPLPGAGTAAPRQVPHQRLEVSGCLPALPQTEHQSDADFAVRRERIRHW